MLSSESKDLVTESATLKAQVSELLKQLEGLSIERDGLNSSLTELQKWSDSSQEMNSRTLKMILKDLSDALAARDRAQRQRDAWRSTTLIAAGTAAGLAIAGPVGAAIGAAVGAVGAIAWASLR
jgi:cell division septum initiation protein DivIVA